MACLLTSVEYPEYSKYILKHQDAFQIGAAFPDWGYACPLGIELPQLPNASECAHWVSDMNEIVLEIHVSSVATMCMDLQYNLDVIGDITLFL
jgi:hypothetical protein